MFSATLRLTKFHICDLFIVLLIIGVVIGNYIWLKIDQGPVQGHGLLGLIPAAQLYNELRGMGNISKNYDHILGRYNWELFYPPLSFFIVVIFYFLFGLPGQMVLMVNSFYTSLTLLGVYLIGKDFFNKPTGLLAALILSSFPGFINFAHSEYWIEFGLMAYVTLDIYLLLKTNFFENRKYSILLGISLALSFLHKYEFIPFVIGPLLLAVYKSGILQDISRKKWTQKATNLILTFILASGLTSFWWARYAPFILKRIFLLTFADENKISQTPYLQNIFSNSSLTFYFHSLFSLIGSVFFTFLLLALITIAIKIIKKDKKAVPLLFLVVWPAFPYIMFTLVIQKGIAHIFSLLPAVAIAISVGLYFIKAREIKIIVVGLLVFYCANLHLGSFPPSRIVYFLNYQSLPRRPMKLQSELAVEEILKFINDDFYQNKKILPSIIVCSKEGAIKDFIFEYYRIVRNYRFKIWFYEWPQALSECDYIVLEDPKGEPLQKIILDVNFGPEQSRAIFLKLFKNGIDVENFDLIKKYDSGEFSVLIYRKRESLIN